MSANDTIFALSSGPPPAAIAVMRVSGPGAGAALAALCGKQPRARRASLRTLRGRDGTVLDRALVLWLPRPRTATGEDVAELHLHGGRATIAAVDAALREEGLRPARGGEFTRRGLEQGRIDLAQAEGLADLLAAETEAERRAAVAVCEGVLSRTLTEWSARLTAVAAMVEARLDHDDEGDVAVERSEIDAAVASLREDIAMVLARPTVERLRDGPTIALAGPPNAGKSSLFNAMLERDAAIVTPMAGTTRDVLDVSVSRGGRVYRLLDTAGLREAEDEVERIGIARAREAAAGAALTIWLGDDEPVDGAALWINARCDVPGRAVRCGTVANVSVHDAASILALWALVERAVGQVDVGVGDFLLNTKQRDAVSGVLAELDAVLVETDDVLIAERLRRCLTDLGALLGHDAPERVLDALFSRFCIGK